MAKVFNPHKASLGTFRRKIDEFWVFWGATSQLPTLHDLYTFLNLAVNWRHRNYESKAIIPLIERQVERIESLLIRELMKTPQGVLRYWEKAFNYKYIKIDRDTLEDTEMNDVHIKLELPVDIKDLPIPKEYKK